ncbi:MAG TPA: ABC transporter permease [Vicinamibacterales bacterium]|nr:ABC transporter permease [Vicinamibacterales bacterium]
MKLRLFLKRLLALFQQRRYDRDFENELAAHLELAERDAISLGMSPSEAAREARLRFGGIERIREEHRDSRSLRFVERITSDVRQSCRSLRRTPTFTLVAVLALGLGIGANGAIFSLVHALVLERPPFPEPDRLVRIVELVPGAETPTGAPMRSSNIRSSDLTPLVANSRTLADVAIYRQGSVVVELSGRAAVVTRAVTLPSLFSVLSVPPAIGRALQAEDGLPGAEKVVVLSHDGWDRWFGRNPKILEQRLKIDGQAHRVVGVMPVGFRFPSVEVWTPLILADVGRGVNTFGVLARLRPEATLGAAAEDTNAVLSAIRRIRPNPTAPPRFTVSRLQEEQAAPFRPAFRILSLAVFLVLLIACSNVANLVVARGTARRREMAIRWALGASRARLFQYLLAESIIVGLLGGLMGLVLAFGSVRLLIAVWPSSHLGSGVPSLAGLATIGVSPFVVLFIAVLSVGTGVVFGMIPALRVSRPDGDALAREREGTSEMSRPTIWRMNLRRLLVIVQVAVATILLISGGLLVRSFVKLTHVELGFSPRNGLTFQVLSPASGAARDSFNDRLVERLSAGVAFPAAYAHQPPLQNGETSLDFSVIGMDEDARRALGREARALPVSYGYLQAIGIRLIAGRYFNEHDDRGGPPVVLVNESLARRYFGRDTPVGRSITTIGPTPFTIVGVVADLRQTALNDPPDPEFYLEFRQMAGAFQHDPAFDYFGRQVSFIVKTDDAAAAIPFVQTAIAQLDPNAIMVNPETLEARLASAQATPRFYAGFVGVISAAGLMLASIGVYGLVAYSVQQRTREIGIRAALGATKRNVLLLVLRDGALSTIVGTAIGVGGALIAAKYLEALLFGITHTDVPTYVGVAGLLLVVSVVAAWLPARRALAVSPLVAIRPD